MNYIDKVLIYNKQGVSDWNYLTRLTDTDSLNDFNIGDCSFFVVDVIEGIENNGFMDSANMIIEHPILDTTLRLEKGSSTKLVENIEFE